MKTDNLAREQTLRDILDYFINGVPITVSGSSTLATSTLQTTGNAILTTINTYMTYEVWDTIVGNSKVFAYYTGTGSGANPSGNTNNIQTITYKTGSTTILTRTFTYDASDNVLTITAS